MNVSHFFEMEQLQLWGYKVANFDLVERLCKVLGSETFAIHEVKSHVDWTQVHDLRTARIFMGNFVADRIASLALQRCPFSLKVLAHNIQRYKMIQKDRLKKKIDYLVDLNIFRMEFEGKKDIKPGSIQAQHGQRTLMCDEAVSVAVQHVWSNTHFPSNVGFRFASGSSSRCQLVETHSAMGGNVGVAMYGSRLGCR